MRPGLLVLPPGRHGRAWLERQNVRGIFGPKRQARSPLPKKSYNVTFFRICHRTIVLNSGFEFTWGCSGRTGSSAASWRCLRWRRNFICPSATFTLKTFMDRRKSLCRLAPRSPCRPRKRYGPFLTIKCSAMPTNFARSARRCTSSRPRPCPRHRRLRPSLSRCGRSNIFPASKRLSSCRAALLSSPALRRSPDLPVGTIFRHCLMRAAIVRGSSEAYRLDI
jgi:hypothetical protein